MGEKNKNKKRLSIEPKKAEIKRQRIKEKK